MTAADYQTDVTVAAIVERDGRFLCIEEVNSRGTVISLPGGHIERGETPEQAAVREVLEETRYDCRLTGFVGAYLWLDVQRALRKLRLVFCAEAAGAPDGRPLDAGVLSVHWRDRDALAAESGRLRSPMLLAALDDYLGGRREQLIVEPGLDTDSLARHIATRAHRV